MDWDISKSSPACTACNKAFAENQEIVSALYDEKEGFIRRDFCMTCAPAKNNGDVIGFWQTRIPPRDAPARPFVDNDIILDIFRRLDGHRDTTKRNFRYVLSLFLMRKKALKFLEFRREEEGHVLLLKDRVTDTVHTVVDPNLSEEEVQRVTEEIGQILNARL